MSGSVRAQLVRRGSKEVKEVKRQGIYFVAYTPLPPTTRASSRYRHSESFWMSTLDIPHPHLSSDTSDGHQNPPARNTSTTGTDSVAGVATVVVDATASDLLPSSVCLPPRLSYVQVATLRASRAGVSARHVRFRISYIALYYFAPQATGRTLSSCNLLCSCSKTSPIFPSHR